MADLVSAQNSYKSVSIFWNCFMHSTIQSFKLSLFKELWVCNVAGQNQAYLVFICTYYPTHPTSNKCPGCNSYVARTDLSNLRVHCTVCSAEKGQLYEFCWLCLQQWKGSQQSSDHCDNDDCMTDLELLKTCPTVTFADVQGVTGCPSTRACPTCGVLLEHDKTGCKNIECKNCNKEFCFVCLKLTSECLKTSKYFIGCSAGVAPRQTSIPSWSDK